MILKFAEALGKRPDQPCPCIKSFRQRSLVAFRFLPKKATEDDFLPPAIIDGEKVKDRCGRYALSFFESVDKAQARFTALADRNDDDGQSAFARYGDHIGQVPLAKSDGLTGEINKQSGHVDFHPAKDVLLSVKVQAYTRIKYK